MWHPGCRGARLARREECAYREYVSDEQRSPGGMHRRPGWCSYFLTGPKIRAVRHRAPWDVRGVGSNAFLGDLVHLSVPASRRALLQIHVCVVLWGFTAILGKAITLGAAPLVWWRMTLVAAVVMSVPRFWWGLAATPRRLVAIYLAIGVIVAMHWLTFYGSIKLANASVAATSAISPNLSWSGAASSPVPRSYRSSNVFAAGGAAVKAYGPSALTGRKQVSMC